MNIFPPWRIDSTGVIFILKTVKKLTILCIMLTFLPICSCGRRSSAYEILEEFCKAYSINGAIYRSGALEHEEGYISDELFFAAFTWEGEKPRDFAVFLNRSVDKPLECGVFAFSDAAEREKIRRMCTERAGLLRNGDYALIISDGFVFYAVVDDPSRAEEIFYLVVG